MAEVIRPDQAEQELLGLIALVGLEYSPTEVLARRVPFSGMPPLTHRFRELGFEIRDGVLIQTLRIGATNCSDCAGLGSFIAYEECESCHGEGCPRCIDGQARVIRVCTTCNKPLDKRG